MGNKEGREKVKKKTERKEEEDVEKEGRTTERKKEIREKEGSGKEESLLKCGEQQSLWGRVLNCRDLLFQEKGGGGGVGRGESI